jgi:predicted dehydrogenase
MITRREFVAGASAAAAAAAFPAWAQDGDPIRVGLVGCGGRGTGAAEDCLTSSPNVKLVALGDLFPDRLAGCRQYFRDRKVEVDEERCFTGFDAYQKVIDSGVDLVIFATPPGFRPIHVEAAVKAGKHVFMEKPVAVDPVGARRVMEAGRLAKEKKLGIVAGTQRRHQKSYVETIQRIHEGAIGKVVAARCYWNQGGLWHADRKDGMSDMEWQCRNWLYFTWLSGDHIVEQHIHNIDVVNWAIGTHPVRAVAVGGRQVRTDPKRYGHIFDHFCVDFEYPDGVHCLSMARQQPNTDGNVSEAIVGTKGRSNPDGSITGENAWRFSGKSPNPYVQEHADLIASIRAGEPLNEAQQVAESTMSAIMGRIAAYTGKRVTWDELMASTLDLSPPKHEFGPLPVPPVARPGGRS